MNWTGFGTKWKVFTINMSDLTEGNKFQARVNLFDMKNCEGPIDAFTVPIECKLNPQFVEIL